MQDGDLAFSVIGSADNAISAVTSGYRGARVNHMGVVVATHHGTFVLEAFPPEVRLTKFEVFSRRSQTENGEPRLLFGRLKAPHRHLIDDALRYGIEQRNIPYDQLYLTGEGALYCSELVVDMFRHANEGTPFFPERPMSFRDSTTGEIHTDWVAYYAYFGMTVPSGEPGSNPGDISKDPRLEIYLATGPIPGLS
ncbi:YiiX/YebB-like N1pC/P60 family cysteine hydrolase [Stappia stellulata]|uniref:YiiX/YebB-like N1pC/P60 family cysteine hydrolase n=1 Tax=Stappia stellulata TaxID=71235 RepID=UPI000418034C|nr:YiiX/YebB-like N1pC/P60 family cysteine hydrolase [Stappia stellulata]